MILDLIVGLGLTLLYMAGILGLIGIIGKLAKKMSQHE